MIPIKVSHNNWEVAYLFSEEFKLILQYDNEDSKWVLKYRFRISLKIRTLLCEINDENMSFAQVFVSSGLSSIAKIRQQ